MPAKHDMIINQFCKTVYGGGSNFALLPHNFIFAKKEATDHVRSIFCEVILLQIARAKVIKQTGGSGVFVSPVSYEEKKESIIRTTKKKARIFFSPPQTRFCSIFLGHFLRLTKALKIHNLLDDFSCCYFLREKTKVEERRRDTSNNGGQSNNKNVEKLKRGIFSSSGYFRTSHVCE